MDSQSGFAMAGGDDIHSYTKNSSQQRAIIDSAKFVVQESITQHIQPLNPHILPQTFHIADLGCSVGPNTFIAVDNILEAIKLKYLNLTNTETPEFQVHFSDQTLNDFNTLFKSLPPNREYYASAVPGSFYSRLFPRGFLHVAHSSYSLHWLSQVPNEITGRSSCAYNKGRVHYVGVDNEEVVNAYSRQHAVDFNKFLEARAQEMVPGGVVMLILPARPNELPHSQLLLSVLFDFLGACLMDLATRGLIDEEKVDEFNVPAYFTSPNELEQVIVQNGRFSIEKMESLPQMDISELQSIIGPQEVSLTIRAVTGELMKKQFGDEILDELFALFVEKLAENWDHITSASRLDLFVLLKLHDEQHTVINN